MKNAPSNPAKIPIIIAADISLYVFELYSIVLNFKAPELERLKGLPSKSDYNIDNVKVAVDVAINTLHSIMKVQNVLGLEIS